MNVGCNNEAARVKRHALTHQRRAHICCCAKVASKFLMVSSFHRSSLQWNLFAMVGWAHMVGSVAYSLFIGPGHDVRHEINYLCPSSPLFEISIQIRLKFLLTSGHQILVTCVHRHTHAFTVLFYRVEVVCSP